jgi:hypothetical protein
VRANVIEADVWQAVLRVLEDPELMAAEVARQRANAGDQRTEIVRQVAVIEAALATCDREAERRANAYAAAVIDLDELKGYWVDIQARRQSLQAEWDACQRQLDAIGAGVEQVDALTGYCARVRQRLQDFDMAEKRRAIEALDLRVRWSPAQPLVIQGSIPLESIADIPSRW